MGRGYFFGLLIGALASVLGFAGASLMLPPTAAPVAGSGTAEVASGGETVSPEKAAEEPEPTEAVADKPASEAVASVTPEAVTEPEPQPEPSPAAEPAVAAPAPVSAPAEGTEASLEADTASTGAEATASVPETPEVEVPAGSEFARPKPEEDPVLPAPEPAPAITETPDVARPEAEAAPHLAEVNPAAMPEGQSEAPSAPAAPDTATAQAVADVPAAETTVPVPPPGEATAPVLATEAPADSTSEIVTAEARQVPEQPAAPSEAAVPAEPVNEPAAEPAPPVAEAAPAPAAPEAAPEPAPVSPTPAAESSTAEPSEDLPPADTGPTIIDIAPRAPIGAANAPQPGFKQSVPGVKVNRLPSIGAEPAADVPGAEPETFAPAPAPEIVLDKPQLPLAETAVARFAARFDNSEAKPLIAVIMLDIGEENGGVAPDALAAIDGPVTIAIDPERPDAAARAAVYRLGGHEVAILAPDLPEGATASDLEVSYQSYVQVLPESVAFIGAPGAAFQSDRRVAQHLVALLATEGRGLVSYARGLNPARQAAAGEGLPHADIYRDLDAGGESATTIARYLDRAAFEAARQGEVVVAGTSAPETVGAIEDWIAAGAKGTVVGPVSAVMLGD
ncbi:divergent polysaccharide deacetylase family protein [Defluviimonas sp. SAOS-178_SWC]|uniref:divergent polysaccharide deacetylase family protein n=1 Tax=Defluviimonas sp. SAOS-178_SWC TaxID=3121287 RepID=UPI003221CD00